MRGWAWLSKHYEPVCYGLALGLLGLALLKPEVQLKQQVQHYLMIADVSQSMNAEDVLLNEQTVSRLAYSQHLMKQLVQRSPCGTYFSLGIFASDNIAMLQTPLEVCKNLDVITDGIDHLEWRMAWKGNSRLSFAVHAATHVYDALNQPAQMLFFTDGDEAPRVNVTIKQDLSGVQIGEFFTFVGVGGAEKVAIPRYNSANKRVGDWPVSDNNNAGAVGVTYADPSQDEPDPPVAYAEYDRMLSQLEEDYLKSLAAEFKGSYVKGVDQPAFYQALAAKPATASFVTDYPLRSFYLLSALVLILATYVPDLRMRRTAGARS
ncbi:VWA domain-containing protein [Methylophilus sp. YYY-1]|uniref:vWA domain-containing protein n=1 Tax=Methylophilus sp. YYY-1 TaxID=2682087 RepID=UPI0023B2C0E0|nr:VWA domain-containing protein [Methylophilus sp. YYY-1]MDF0377247.1 VWA domain-containing protein [Methylophilus sp. YYY-1]